MSIELGYFVNPEYPSTYPVHQAIREQRHLVALAADLGMTSVFVGEHYSHGDFAWLPPLMLIGGIHDAAPGMRYGTAVLAAPLHNPVVLAEQAAYLDAATGGNFVLGLAAGWNPNEFAALGEPLAGRGARLEQSITLMRSLWAGERVKVGEPETEIRLGLRPAQGGPHVWLGGSSARALDRAARLADAWVISSHVPASAALEQVDLYRERLAAQGRPMPSVRPGLRNIYVGRTHEEAVTRCAPFLTASYAMFDEWGLFKQVLDDHRPELDFERAAERAIIGSVEEVAEQLIEFVRASDLNLLLARSQWLGIPHAEIEHSMGLLATEVMPLVNSALAGQGAST